MRITRTCPVQECAVSSAPSSESSMPTANNIEPDALSEALGLHEQIILHNVVPLFLALQSLPIVGSNSPQH